ncbi:hypothetical protein [Nitrospira tepida]|uniref:hypothetical protein n=1 Tax=Nitrospira tepida TaxID=2973512 RepID=UPI00259C7714|nr:hypothetical protein [Nitrospira tepida]
MFDVLLTSALTIIGGVVVFSLSQIVQRFLVEPVHEQAKVIGEIFFGLVYYADRYANPGTGKMEAMTEVADTMRRYASRLAGTTHAVRCYRLFECFGLAPNREAVDQAVHKLIRISNSVHTGNGRENSADADNVRKLLSESTRKSCRTWRPPRLNKSDELV